ncbi:hypothetical protein RND81_06G043500 [Saponaria officinalis]|uniref:FHA domain-containing protein n=1 Tax=Saponaria officinalis TaxID=3572 RepID=A0AAW1K5R9_SAPOF
MATLKLIIEKGPRSGETQEFNSRSTIRLARVVHGNNLTVKDPGISSKQLSIEFDSNLRKWVITDLDSSNGTILNSSQLKPLSPFVIHDGDECGGCEGGGGAWDEKRRTRSSRKEVEEFVSLEMPVRRTRSAKIMEDVTVREVEEGSKIDEEAGNVGVVENEMCGDFSKRVEGSLFAREQPCAKSIYDTVQCDVLGDATNGSMLVEVEAEAGAVLSLNPQPISEPSNEIDEKSELKDEANIHRLEVEAPKNVDDRASQDEITVGVEKQTPDKVENDLASEDQVMEELASGEIPEETGISYRGGMTDHEPVPTPDLEKMTLGEWFDYLEAYLPKQIYDVTDEIVDHMRKRAKQFDAFMLEQQQ